MNKQTTTMNKKVTIKIITKTFSPEQSFKSDQISILGELKATEGLSEHDIAAQLFAIEFAANNHAEVAMRVHIFLE